VNLLAAALRAAAYRQSTAEGRRAAHAAMRMLTRGMGLARGDVRMLWPVRHAVRDHGEPLPTPKSYWSYD
jgi:hypothetical protein